MGILTKKFDAGVPRSEAVAQCFDQVFDTRVLVTHLMVDIDMVADRVYCPKPIYGEDSVVAEYKNRGPEKYPHWHDAATWATKTTMTYARLKSMTPDEFACWVYDNNLSNDVMGFFYGNRDPEGLCYCMDHHFAAVVAYPGYIKHKHNWNPILLGDDKEPAGELQA